MEPTIGTYYENYQDTPTRSMPERTREEFNRDNKPSKEAFKLGLSFVKHMHPNTYKPYLRDSE